MSIMSIIQLNRFPKSENSWKVKGTEGRMEYAIRNTLRGAYCVLRFHLGLSSAFRASSVIWLALALMVSLAGAGCGTSSSSPDNLEVRVRDHEEAIDNFSELWLTISAVGIHPAGQPRTEGWIEVVPSLQKLDLTEYVEGPEAIIVQATVETGAYDAVRLTVDRAAGTLIDGQQIEVEGSFDPVALDFWIKDGKTTILRVDLLVLDVSEHAGLSYQLHIREVTVN